MDTPKQLQDALPQTKKQASFIAHSRNEIEAILNGVDQRLLLIVGPCSVHDPEATIDYAKRFKELAKSVSDRFLLVMRTYFEKPRTTIGWKGLLYDPHLDGSYEVQTGVHIVRKLVSDLTDLEVPIGSELLEMTTAHYYADYLAWGCIGARTAASPPHRQFASSLPFPIGFKNTTDGNVEAAIQGITSANSSHVFLGLNTKGEMARIYTSGNPDCHIILRGSEIRPNYFPHDVAETIEKCKEAGVQERLLVDCSHDNSFKIPEEQIPVLDSVIDQVAKGNHKLVGAMLESNIHAGTQLVDGELKYGVSITDPCLSWETTERVIKKAHDRLSGVPSEQLCLVY